MPSRTYLLILAWKQHCGHSSVQLSHHRHPYIRIQSSQPPFRSDSAKLHLTFHYPLCCLLRSLSFSFRLSWRLLLHTCFSFFLVSFISFSVSCLSILNLIQVWRKAAHEMHHLIKIIWTRACTPWPRRSFLQAPDPTHPGISRKEKKKRFRYRRYRYGNAGP